jgi:hypothetical protein
VRLCIRYLCAADLSRDLAEQFNRGGVLVKVEPPSGLTLYAAVELVVAHPHGQVTLGGQVVQLLPGVGIAVAVANVELAALGEALASMPAQGSGPPEHSIGGSQPPHTARAAPHKSADAFARFDEATPAEKMHMAAHGNRDERLLAIRDRNRSLHIQVLRNPHLGLDEVAAIARMTSVDAGVLVAIAEKREWFGRPEIASALARNPRVPIPIAVRMVEHVAVAELRRLAKDMSVRAPVRQAAAKKVTQG